MSANNKASRPDPMAVAMLARLDDLDRQTDRLRTVLSGPLEADRGIALAKALVTADRAAAALARHADRLG